MIIIDTTKFKEYEKLILYAKNTENKYRSHFCLNFEKSCVEIMGENFVFSFKFEFKSDDDIDKPYPIVYVSIMEFLSLCKAYNSINFDSVNYNLSSGEDKFTISTFVDDDTISFKDEIDISESFIDNEAIIPITIDNSFVSEMITAMAFSPKAGEGDPLEGLRIFKNDVFTSDHTSLYQNRISDKEIINPTDVPLSLVFILRQLPSFGNYTIYFGKEAILVYQGDDDFSLYLSQSISLEFPDNPYDEEFRSTFDHETGFSIDRDILKENVKFFEPFTQSVQNEAIHLYIGEENITLSVNSGIIAGSKKIEIDSVDESIIGTDLLLPRYLIMKALNVLNGEEIEIRVNPEKHAITFREPEYNDNKYVVITRMYEDN